MGREEYESRADGTGLAECGRVAAKLSPALNEIVEQAVEAFARRARLADRSPRVLVDNDGNVLWRSSEAERLMREPMPLRIDKGRLHASAGQGPRSWTSFLDTLGEEGDRILLTDKAEATWVLVSGWAERFGQQRLVFLKCAMSWPFRDVANSGLAKDFGLTRSECAVLDEFARLRKPAQIAEALGISVNTVRSHLKQIHAKMAVNSGVQMLRITRAYCDT